MTISKKYLRQGGDHLLDGPLNLKSDQLIERISQMRTYFNNLIEFYGKTRISALFELEITYDLLAYLA